MGCGCASRECRPFSGTHYGDQGVITIIIDEGLATGALDLDGGGPALEAVSRENAKKACAVSLREANGYSEACNPASCALGWFQFMPLWGFGERRCSPHLTSNDFWTTWLDVGWHPWNGDIDDDGTLTGAAYLYGRASRAYSAWLAAGGGGDDGGGGGGDPPRGKGGWGIGGSGSWMIVRREEGAHA